MRWAPVLLGLVTLAGCSSSTSEPNNKLQLRTATSAIPIAAAPSTSKQQKTEVEPPKKKTDPQPAAKWTDAEIAQLLVGHWEENRTQADQGVYERQMELTKTGSMSFRGSIRYPNASQTSFIVSGTWKVAEGKLLFDVLASDAPRLIPIGTKTADLVVTANTAQFSCLDSLSNQLRHYRRIMPKTIQEAPKQNLDGEYERLLRGFPWTDRMVQPNGVVVTRHLTFELRGEMTAAVRYVGNKQDVRVMLICSWQVSDGMLNLVVKTSSHPQIIAIGLKSSDKIKHVTADEFAYIDSVTKLIRVMQRFKD